MKNIITLSLTNKYQEFIAAFKTMSETFVPSPELKMLCDILTVVIILLLLKLIYRDRENFWRKWGFTWHIFTPCIRWFCLLVAWGGIKSAVMKLFIAQKAWNQIMPSWILITANILLVVGIIILIVMKKRNMEETV